MNKIYNLRFNLYNMALTGNKTRLAEKTRGCTAPDMTKQAYGTPPIPIY